MTSTAAVLLAVLLAGGSSRAMLDSARSLVYLGFSILPTVFRSEY